MKNCNKCFVSKDLKEFDRNINRKDGFERYCKQCRQEYSQQHYKNHKQSYINRAAKVRKQLADWLFEFKKTLSCSRCGYNKHPAALDFHHPNNDKIKSVAVLTGSCGSKKKILAEIRKCIVLCANCHRIEHYE